MILSSLSMAPAFVVAQQAGVVDFNGPLLQSEGLLSEELPSEDIGHGLELVEEKMLPFSDQLWS